MARSISVALLAKCLLRVKRVDSVMSATGPLTLQLRTIWCNAVKQRNVPKRPFDHLVGAEQEFSRHRLALSHGLEVYPQLELVDCTLRVSSRVLNGRGAVPPAAPAVAPWATRTQAGRGPRQSPSSQVSWNRTKSSHVRQLCWHRRYPDLLLLCSALTNAGERSGSG
jgi:hypothetical protein